MVSPGGSSGLPYSVVASGHLFTWWLRTCECSTKKGGRENIFSDLGPIVTQTSSTFYLLQGKRIIRLYLVICCGNI